MRATRTAQRLTQEQVAALTKDSPWQLSRAAISAIERGQNFPGMEAMLALAHVLYVDPKELIERARLTTALPVDLTGISPAELDRRAAKYFWSGDYRNAIAVYDGMLEQIALEESPQMSAERVRRVATLEVRRATALRRAGALLSALATIERAISLSIDHPDIQAEAYVVLAGLQCDRGHLPLAHDAAKRAVALAESAEPRIRGWAWVVRASALYLSERYEEAKQAYLEARKLARDSDDVQHMTHIEGNIGMCWLAQGQASDARTWVRRAIELARRHAQPMLEASWLVEQGKIALQDGQLDEADGCAQAALRIGKPLEHHATVFRAEWLRHGIAVRRDPADPDRHRLAYLRKLFLHLDQHEGIEEVREFKHLAARSLSPEGGKQS